MNERIPSTKPCKLRSRKASSQAKVALRAWPQLASILQGSLAAPCGLLIPRGAGLAHRKERNITLRPLYNALKDGLPLQKKASAVPYGTSGGIRRSC